MPTEFAVVKASNFSYASKDKACRAVWWVYIKWFGGTDGLGHTGLCNPKLSSERAQDK